VVAITGADAAAFRAIGAREVVVVPNGIDTGALAGVAPDPAARRLFFLGNYDYPPNRDAVRWLCEEIMPRIWAAAPDVTLLLHGHAMPAAWRQRWPDERIDFAGYAPDLARAHGSSSAFVAPLRSGGGSKLKVLEAMAASLPVIGTREAMSGLAAVPGQDWMEAETAAEIAAAARSSSRTTTGRRRRTGSRRHGATMLAERAGRRRDAGKGRECLIVGECCRARSAVRRCSARRAWRSRAAACPPASRARRSSAPTGRSAATTRAPSSRPSRPAPAAPSSCRPGATASSRTA
jgi:hypothetical protein